MDYIVLRLVPRTPTNGADFADYLANLKITAHDVSFNSVESTALPSAIGQSWYEDGGSEVSRIRHHLVGMGFKSVATAVIDITQPPPPPPLRPEYDTSDIILVVTRNGDEIARVKVDYNVHHSDETVVPDPNDIAAFQNIAAQNVAAYVPLPSPGLLYSELLLQTADGQPPRYSVLKEAVETVLEADPGGTAQEIEDWLKELNPDQARHIAKEIVYNRAVSPLPAPETSAVERYYTRDALDFDDSGRESFEGDLLGYRARLDVEAESLARYIYALGAALKAHEWSVSPERARFGFPVCPCADKPPPYKRGEAEVVLLLPSVPPPEYEVPAAYFYALTADLPLQMTAESRFRMVTFEEEAQIIEKLEAALQSWIIEPQSVNPARAARRMGALGNVRSGTAVPIEGEADVIQLVEAWLTRDDNKSSEAFWNDFVITPNPAHQRGHLHLLMWAIIEENPSNIIDELPVSWVQELANTTAADWRQYFAGDPEADPPISSHWDRLPEFTRPGSQEERFGAFLSRMRQYFVVAGGLSEFDAPAPNQVPGFGIATGNPLQVFFDTYASLDPEANEFLNELLTLPRLDFVDQAVATVFGDDHPNRDRARDWLRRSVVALNHLWFVSVDAGNAAPRFAVVEALYARGFTTTDSIAALSESDFTDALVGTVAHGLATSIYGRAPASPPPNGGGVGSRRPVNPGGALVNCVPPEHQSPLGSAAYLKELLSLSSTATCNDPGEGGDTLESLLNGRRGSFGVMSASSANLNVAQPLIDRVNECLEAMAAGDPSGAVYDTAPDELAGHQLRGSGLVPPTDAFLHDPETLFAALPEHSSPATPVARPDAYAALRSDFSRPILPYSQPLDVSRSYLARLGTSRFAAMRRFRERITEFVLTPTVEPAGFLSHLWRYPVREDLAFEYLGINPEEAAIFTSKIAGAALASLYGYPASMSEWMSDVLNMANFLERTGLEYCEFYELVTPGSDYLGVQNGTGEGEFAPVCEPCCLITRSLLVGAIGQEETLRRLASFIRLWKKLRRIDPRITATQLVDIAQAFQWFTDDDETNPDFIRQLAALQMLRDDFCLPLIDRCEPVDPEDPPVGPDRTHLLALWAASAAKQDWAIDLLVKRVGDRAVRRFGCPRRPAQFLKLLRDNLESLSRLAGFGPGDSDTGWKHRPTHTLRFAEILTKIYASKFSIGEILFLFTVDPLSAHLAGDDPLPLASANETVESPLDLPDDDPSYSLWALRSKLLSVEVPNDDIACWSWGRIVASLCGDFGYVPQETNDPVQLFGEHFFPTVVMGPNSTDATKRQYRTGLANTPELMWNTPVNGPFRYDNVTRELYSELGLTDEAVLAKLCRIRQLDDAERAAVQELYFAPRADLARLAFLFPNFLEADERLIQETDEAARWLYFQRAYALAHARARVIAEHLAAHVGAATGTANDEGTAIAWTLLKHLLGDENQAKTTWEDDGGARPEVTWGPIPSGGAFAALLGLVGTGLRGEARVQRDDGTQLVFRELRGPLGAFGAVRNGKNAPFPTLIPALDLDRKPRFATVRNGFALQNDNAEVLGGAQGFHMTWRGMLLVEESGDYTFHAGSPTPDGELPSDAGTEDQRWEITLQRGQKKWRLINHEGPGRTTNLAAEQPLSLKRGVYELVIEFEQCPPDFDSEDPTPAETGFQLKYAGPDTGNDIVVLPTSRLYVDLKDSQLMDGVAALDPSTLRSFLSLFYHSTLRDVRRTYERAFKAALFVERLSLSAARISEAGQSEIGYLLAHPAAEFSGVPYPIGFEGLSFFHDGTSYQPHRAHFDFNLLPVGDNYMPPDAAQDRRAEPTMTRQQALFDWWERLFDYTGLRAETQSASEAPAWLLFHEAAEVHPDPAHLLRHLGVDLSRTELVLKFYDISRLGSLTLMDERWPIRVWRAEQWLRERLHDFTVKDIGQARPALWASDDPSTAPSGETGNQNLTRFVRDGWLENGSPVRYEDLKRLNDGLRLRARDALVAYLTSPAYDRIPLPNGDPARTAKDLGDYLLLDVEAGLCQRASRIEEAVTAGQNLVQRARLGLEGYGAHPFTPNRDFNLLWDRGYADLSTWQSCTRRRLYPENFVEWNDLRVARRSEAFRFFEDQLRSRALTIATPTGTSNWKEQRPPTQEGLQLLQAREPSTLGELPSAATLPLAGHGFTLLGVPDRHARLSWLSSPVLGAGDTEDARLPYWIEAAVRLGVEFLRIAAAGPPMGAATFDRTLQGDTHGCCRECGAIHPPNVDEYYFWLLNGTHFESESQDAYEQIGEEPDPNESGWRDPEQAPQLLSWESKRLVHLVWARVHNGELKPLRRSDEGVKVDRESTPKLIFLGRQGDSLKFQVEGGHSPVGHTDTSQPGFRYDLPTDTAVVLPEVFPAPEPNSWVLFSAPVELSLPAYPFFLSFTPGAPLVPLTFYSQATVAAGVLRSHCRYEAALKWYDEWLPVLQEDASWCPDLPDGSCCSGGEANANVARRRSLVLNYVETLLEWGDALMRGHSPEVFQRARLIYDTATRILGESPRSVSRGILVRSFADFEPAKPALNPRLLALYERVEDRLALVHHCLTATRLKHGREQPYLGDTTRPTALNPCAKDEWCAPSSPYRFMVLVQQALDLAREVQSLGGQLLSAFEKGDAEYLASLRVTHERQLLGLALSIRQNQWRDADWQVQALQKTKEMAQTRRRYFNALIQVGLINEETAYRDLTNTAMVTRATGNTMRAVAQVMHMIPDAHVGTCNFVDLPIGSKLARVFETIATVADAVADILSTRAGLRLTEAGWVRRQNEWIHQVEVLDIEIEQIERQLLGAERRRDVALRELNNHQRQIEQSSEVLEFLRDKFTAHDLYLWMQRETAALHYQMYELALQAARQAQHAFNFELGYLEEDFLGEDHWDNLHEGLLAGERLSAALRRMQKAYYDTNPRDYELSKQLSLRERFPLKLLQLKTTGSTEIELPEWSFDLDYPGHYLRRIKNVSLSIPSVLGPFTGVHCRLTLISSQTRIDPRLTQPPGECCSRPSEPQPATCWPCGEEPEPNPRPERPAPRNGYPALPDDPRIVKLYGAREAIATSTAQSDTGLFELNFRDERYLPFEYHGAVSRWRIELPAENNYFDLSTLTDVVLEMRYTAREGGEALRAAASKAARHRSPDSGLRVVDIRQELPDVWHRFIMPAPDAMGRTLELKLEREFFPFLPGQPAVEVTRFEFLFETPCPEPSQNDPKAVVSPPAEMSLEVTLPPTPCQPADSQRLVKIVRAVTSAEWPGLYHGMLEVRLEPMPTRIVPANRATAPIVKVKFPEPPVTIASLYVLIGYEAHDGELVCAGRTHGAS